MAVDLGEEREIFWRNQQFRCRAGRLVADPMRKEDLHPLGLLRRFLFKGLPGQDVNRTGAPGVLLQHGVGDGEEIQGRAPLVRGNARLKAGVEQGDFWVCAAVEDGEVEHPDAVGGGIDGALIAEGFDIHGLARLDLVDLCVLRAVEDQVAGFAEVGEELPFWVGKGIVDAGAGGGGLDQAVEGRGPCGVRFEGRAGEKIRGGLHGGHPVRQV